MAGLPVYTVGHSTRSLDEFVALLRAGAVEEVVDVRRFPRSRTNPQFNIEVLGAELGRNQIGYSRIEELGGRRGRSPETPTEINAFWDNQSFHNFADYALTAGFRRGLAELQALAAERRTAVMCSEAVWWRCHRRIIADYLIASGKSVFHLMDDRMAVPAEMTETAVMAADGLHYPRAGDLFGWGRESEA